VLATAQRAVACQPGVQGNLLATAFAPFRNDAEFKRFKCGMSSATEVRCPG
jgi:hypothetical protein